MKERLQKLLAQANATTSRRAAETLIESGRVRVNGVIAKLGDKADPAQDTIQVDGNTLKFRAAKKLYIALNKPKGVLSTTEPHKGDKRQTVYDLVGIKENLFSIGRLDADSEGLVVLTNDGDLAQRLTHPRYRHSKTYKVEVDGLPGMDVLDKWRNGVILDEDERTGPCVVILLEGDRKVSTLRIIMTEGRKRQIRRVGMKLEHRVRRLVRTHIGMLPIGELRPGEWRELSAKDLELLKTPSPELRVIKRRLQAKPKAGSGAVSADARPSTPRPDRPKRPVRSDPLDDEADAPRRPRNRLVDDDSEIQTPRSRPIRSEASRPSAGRPRPSGDGERSEGESRPARKPSRPGMSPSGRPRPSGDGERSEGESRPARKPSRPGSAPSSKRSRPGSAPSGKPSGKPGRPGDKPARPGTSPAKRRTPKDRK